MKDSRTTLFRLDDPVGRSQGRSGVDSIVYLAKRLPDAYVVQDFVPDMSPDRAPPQSVILCRAFGPVAGRVSWVLNQPGVRAWIAAGIPLVFDQSPEIGPTARDTWREFRDIIHASGAGSGRFIWLQQNERGPERCAEIRSGTEPLRVESLVFHYWLHHTRLAASETPPRPAPELRRRRFLCLNRRLRVHRAAILGRLLREDLLQFGLVSAPKLILGDDPVTWKSHQDYAASALKLGPGFRADIESYDSVISDGLTLDDGRSHPSEIPWNLHAETGFSLVNETEMAGRHTRRFTEKTLKAMAAWHPLVVAGNMGTLQLLRDYGFKTFSPWIDESYDLIEPLEGRLGAVLAEAKRLITMPENEFDLLLAHLQPVLEHNHRHFMDGLPAIMDSQHAAFRRVVAEMAAA